MYEAFGRVHSASSVHHLVRMNCIEPKGIQEAIIALIQVRGNDGLEIKARKMAQILDEFCF